MLHTTPNYIFNPFANLTLNGPHLQGRILTMDLSTALFARSDNSCEVLLLSIFCEIVGI